MTNRDDSGRGARRAIGYGPLADHARAAYPGGDAQGRYEPWQSSLSPAEASTEIGSDPARDDFGLVRGLLWSLAITGCCVAAAAVVAWLIS